MIDFDFVAPTRIVFGKKSEERLGGLLREYGFKRVFLIYGGGSIKRSGLYDKVVSEMSQNGVSFEELSGIRANPTLQSVKDGIEKARKFKPDLLLAVGGGSVIDAAKSIGVGYFYDGDPFDFNLKKAAPEKTLPVGVILTIASAGSEMSNSCVISNDSTSVKQGFNSDLIRPLFAIENPELTYTVSPYQTAAGFSDIMMHSLERFFGESDSLQLSDDWALDLVANVMEAGFAFSQRLYWDRQEMPLRRPSAGARLERVPSRHHPWGWGCPFIPGLGEIRFARPSGEICPDGEAPFQIGGQRHSGNRYNRRRGNEKVLPFRRDAHFVQGGWHRRV